MFPAGKGCVFHCLGPLPWVSVNQEGKDPSTPQQLMVGVLVELLKTLELQLQFPPFLSLPWKEKLLALTFPCLPWVALEFTHVARNCWDGGAFCGPWTCSCDAGFFAFV